MAYRYIIDPEVNCVFIQHFDDFNLTEVGEQYEVFLNDPEHFSGVNILRDLRRINIPPGNTYQDISDEAKKVFAAYDRRLGHSKLALVVGNRDDYIVAHQWIVTGRFSDKAVDRKLFREIDKAWEWLGIPEDYEIKYSSEE
jgi:hypothetical protein